MFTAMSSSYQHRQTGRAALAVIVLLAVVPLRHFAFAAALQRATVATPFAVVALLALLVAGILVSGLTITVEHGHIVWSFGPGFFRRTVPLQEVESVETGRVPWRHVPGVRRTDGAVSYAIAGGGAVELRLRDGRRIRLGTDDPEGLVHAIQEGREAA